MLLRRGFTVLKIILSSYYQKVHAFVKGVQAFEKGLIFFGKWLHVYKNNIILILLGAKFFGKMASPL